MSLMNSKSGDNKPQNPGPSIWVADDDIDDQLLIQTAFDEFKPPVSLQFFNDGQELVECLAQKPLLPHFILLDLNMPRLDGFRALAPPARTLAATPGRDSYHLIK